MWCTRIQQEVQHSCAAYCNMERTCAVQLYLSGQPTGNIKLFIGTECDVTVVDILQQVPSAPQQ